MPAESKLRAYIKKTREIIASDDFTLGLTEDQKRQVIDGFKKRIAELSAAESAAFKQEAEGILIADEYEKAQRARENARSTSDGATVLNALVRGGASLPTNAAALTAQAADMAGLKDTAMLLDQYAKDTDYDTEQMFPRAAEDSGYPIRILEAAGENAPTMLATGLGTKALLSGVGRLGVTSNRAAKTLEVLGTAAGMSVPELRKDSVQTNLYGGVIPLENPSAVLAGAIPHALIETGMGVTPLGLVSGAGKSGLFKKGFSELLARYQRRYGSRAAGRLLLDRIMTETPLGEGMEEGLQNPVGVFTRNLANNDLSTAIQKTGDEITKPGYLGQLGEEFIIGTGVGAVYSGAKALRVRQEIDRKIEDPKIPVAEKQQLAMAKERLQIENQARLQLPYTGDASTVLPDGSPITDVPDVAARDPRSRNIVSILPDGTPVYDEGDARLTSPALVDQPLLPQPAITELLPAPPSAVELGNMFLRTHARGDQVGAQALRDYAESRGNTAPRARVEPLKGGEYDRMTVRVDGVQIPTENRTLLRGNPDAAARLEKKLLRPQTDVILPQKSKAGDQADKKQWYIDADDMPVFTTKSDAIGYRGPYSKQEIKDLTEVDPSTLTEKTYGKDATIARRKATNQATVKQSEPVAEPKAAEPQAKAAEPIKQPTVKTALNTPEAEWKKHVATSQYKNDIARLTAESKELDRKVNEIAKKVIDEERVGIGTITAGGDAAAVGYALLLEDALLEKGLNKNPELKAKFDKLAEQRDEIDATLAAMDSDYNKAAKEGAEARKEIEQYFKEKAEPAKQPAYKVESYQGGFRVLDSEGKQYSWHTSKQAADDKAADLNSGKIAPVKSETKPVSKPETQPATRITAENAEMLANAQRLRKSAASLLDQAQADLNRDRQTNTARRARMAAGATDDAANREAFAKTMINLADAMERGEVRYLKGVKSRPDLMLFKNELTLALGRHARKNDKAYDWYKKELVTDAAIRDGAEFNRPHPYGDWFDHAAKELEAIQGMKPAAAYIEKLGRGNRSRNVSLSDEAIGKILDIKKTISKKGVKTPYQFARILETVEDYQKLKAAGIKSDFDLADALIEYRNLEAGKKQESPLVKAERELIGKKFEGFDFFPTPPALAERMAQELDIKPGMKVLEPSAGKGDLADAVKAAQPEADVKVIEPLSDLREILTMKNHEVIDTNFENFETDQKFDRIIMNPPFSKNRDIRHVRKAYELLAPGGKMVAIMGNHFTFANDKESVEFRDWLDAVGGTSESLGQVFAGKDAFRQTGVNSQLVTIEKPAETSFKAEPGKAEVSGQTVETPPATSDLVKPEEKDFESATDYLKALTKWREKTGNLTAAEVKRRDRALRFADRAAKTGQKASGLFRQADKISERFYMGQPILVGHHSERGARAAQNRMHNKMDAALKEEKKAEYYSQRAESAEKNKSISSADEDAIVKLKAKLESLSKVQERMKQANKVVKASKLSDAEKITKLQEQGFSEAKAKNLLEKDFAGRVGFPAYALQNNNAEMSRLKKRIEELSVKQSQQTQKIEFDGGEIVDNVAENRLQIFFDSKPDEATREKLKSNGFRWAPSAGAWQMHRSTWANRKAESITGAKIPAAQPAQAAPVENQSYTDQAETGEPAKAEPVRQLYKNDDIIFRFPDGRETGAYIIDPEPKTIDGTPDQVYVKMDNGAVRFIPQDWITKSKHSPMVQNRLDAEKTEATRAAKPAVPVSKNVKVADDGRKVITVFTDYKKAYAAMEKEAGILLTPSQNAEASWWTVYYKSKLIGNLQRSSHESGFLFTYDHDMQRAETEDFAAKRKKTAEELIAEVKSVTRKYLDEDPRFKTRTEIASRDIRAGAGVTALRSAPMPGNAFGKIPGGKNKGFYIGKDGYVLEDATVAIDGRPEIETGYEQRPDVPAINVLIDKYGFDKNATGLIAVPNYSRKGAFGDAFKLFATDGKDAQTIIAGEEISASVQITENPVTGEEVYFNYELLRAAQIELGELSLAQIGKDELNRRAGMFKNKDGRIAIIAEFDAKAGGNDLISQITKASGLGRRGAVLNPAVFAKYAASRIAAKFSAGFELLRSGVTQFAQWARQMVNTFGKAIRKHLRNLWADLTAVLQSRRGMIRIAGWKSPQMIANIQRVSDTANARRRTMREISSVYTDMDFRQNRNRMGSAAQPMSDRWIAQLEAAGANPFIDNNGADQRRRANARFREQQARAYAEIAAREIVEPGSPAAKEATEAFFKEWAERFGGRRGAALNLGGDAMTIFLNGATKFADWARALVKKYGKSVTSLLKNLWTDLDNFNKRLGRTGAISGRPVGLKNSGSGQSSPAPDKTAGGSPAESKQMVTSRGLVWKRIDKDTYELELTDPNTGKTSVVETIRRPKGTDNIWNVDNWTTFDNKGTGSGSFTSLKVAKAAIKAHARDAFNQRIYRENGVVKDRQRDEALKKKRERGLEQDKERDAREAAQLEKRKEKAEEFIAKGKKKKAPEPEKPKTWRDHARSFVAKAEEVLFDAWAPVRRLQETIKKAAGVSELPESLDLYQKLEVVAGKVEAGTRIFKDKYFKQIKDYLVENNINYNEANRFLAIMHAKERNDAIAGRNPAFALTGAPGSGIETETARKEIAEYKKNGTYEKLLKFARMTYRLNNALLDEQVRYGLLSQKQRDAYRRYKNYTPMKSPPDQGFVLDRTAFGRRSEATDQLAYIEKAIDVVYKRGERKQVINTALNLFSKYSNPKLYREYEPDQVQYYDKRTGKVRLRTDTSKLYNNPAVIWSRDVNSAELKAFEIKDPGLQNALNRQYSDTGVEQKAFRYFAGVNRWLAGVSTAYNPEFIFTNLLRDVQQGAASVGVNLPEGSVKKFVENLGRAKKAIADARAGKVTVDTGLLEEFQLAGGKTGYSELSRLEDTARNLEREISEAQTGGRWYDTKQSLVKVRDWIADWNDAIETRTRFAGYLTAKEAGFSTQKSAAFAKGMTINFNKKGTWAPVFNSLYLFSSASLGGSFVTANIIGKAAKTPKGRAMIAGAIGLGFVMELLNRAVAGDDDDEGVNYYDKVPDYIKDSNYVFMVPGTKGKYFAIPMPYGLNVLPSIGRNMAASMFGVQSFKAGAANVVGAVLNSFNPIGGDNRGFGYQLVPTAARPFIDIATNSSWTGRKIRPDQPAFGAKLARSELYFDQESKVLTAATRALNELTGGDRFTGGFVSLSPADVSHLLESFTGGVGRTLSRSADTVTRVVTGESPELDNVPVVRRFGGEATDYNTWQTFKENSEIVEDFERARRERNIEYLRANRQLLPAVALYKNIGKRITSVRKKPSLSEPEKQKLILSMQKSFNKKFREIRDKALSKN